MTAPAAIPSGRILIEKGPVYRATILTPFSESVPSDAPDLIDRVNVYWMSHGAAAGGWQPLTTVDLPYQVDDDTQEFTFVPTTPGIFAFSFLNKLDEEGDISDVIPYCYLNFADARTIVDAICLEEITTSQLFTLLDQTREQFENWTRNHFFPRYETKMLSGNGAYEFTIEEPIVCVESVAIRTDQYRVIDPAIYMVFNRHVAARKAWSSDYPTLVDGRLEAPGDGTGGMTNPDDRQAPRVSFRISDTLTRGQRIQADRGFRSSGRGQSYWGSNWAIPMTEGFFRGNQNITVKGFFGWTAPDLSTPFGVVRGAGLILRRLAAERYGSMELRREVLYSNLKIMEKTDTHTVMWQKAPVSVLTGDPEIDQIIMQFIPPPRIGGVL